MLLCSCNIISEREIKQTIVELLTADPWQLIVPLKVFHAMSQRGRCCGCFPNVSELIVKTSEEFHQKQNSQDAKIVDFLQRLKEKNKRDLVLPSRKIMTR